MYDEWIDQKQWPRLFFAMYVHKKCMMFLYIQTKCYQFKAQMSDNDKILA